MRVRDLDDVELRALAFVDEREIVRDLVELVAVPSVSGHITEHVELSWSDEMLDYPPGAS